MIWLKAIICLKMNIHLASFDNLGQIIMSWVLRPICTNLSTKLYRGQVIVLTEIITVGADLVSARARDIVYCANTIWFSHALSCAGRHKVCPYNNVFGSYVRLC